MSEMRSILADTAERLFAAHCGRALAASAEAGTWPAALWQALEAAGLTLADVGDADLGDVMTVLRAAGQHSAPVPLAETWLAGWMLGASGLEAPAGPLIVAPVLRGDALTLARAGAGWRLSGRARAVPWARDCADAVVLATVDGRSHVALVPLASVEIARGHNLAGEPRDDVTFADVALPATRVAPAGENIDPDALWRRGALARAVAMAGALETVMALAVRYANERVQFGRPIGKFQAVQQQLAILAGNVAAACAAVDAAVAAAEQGDASFAIAVAKVRCGETATLATAIAHQVHGAMGFTQEHPLHLSSRRLWSWREEFGDESAWSQWLGRAAARIGGDGLWAFLTDRQKTLPVPL